MILLEIIELQLKAVWDIETAIGLRWCLSTRDAFRHMWE